MQYVGNIYVAKIVADIHPRALAGVMDATALAASCASAVAIPAAIILRTDNMEMKIVLPFAIALMMVPGIAHWLYASRSTAAARGHWFPLDTASMHSVWGADLACLWGALVVVASLTVAVDVAVEGSMDVVRGATLSAMTLPATRMLIPTAVSLVRRAV